MSIQGPICFFFSCHLHRLPDPYFHALVLLRLDAFRVAVEFLSQKPRNHLDFWKIPKIDEMKTYKIHFKLVRICLLKPRIFISWSSRSICIQYWFTWSLKDFRTLFNLCQKGFYYIFLLVHLWEHLNQVFHDNQDQNRQH